MKSIHAYLTLRCLNGCSYCSNRLPVGEAVRHGELVSAYWQGLFVRIQDFSLYLTGGEPFLYRGLADILSDLKRSVFVYTSLREPIKSVLKKVRRRDRVIFRCSYHPEMRYYEQFRAQYDEVRRLGFSASIFMVDRGAKSRKVVDRFKEDGYGVIVDADQRKIPCKKGRVACRLPTTIVSPSGHIYHCVSRMLRGVGRGNMIFDRHIPEPATIECGEPHLCTPCDRSASFQEEKDGGKVSEG